MFRVRGLGFGIKLDRNVENSLNLVNVNYRDLGNWGGWVWKDWYRVDGDGGW